MLWGQQNRRPDYVTKFINSLASWDAAEEQRFASANAFMNFGEPDIPELLPECRWYKN